MSQFNYISMVYHMVSDLTSILIEVKHICPVAEEFLKQYCSILRPDKRRWAVLS